MHQEPADTVACKLRESFFWGGTRIRGTLVKLKSYRHAPLSHIVPFRTSVAPPADQLITRLLPSSPLGTTSPPPNDRCAAEPLDPDSAHGAVEIAHSPGGLPRCRATSLHSAISARVNISKASTEAASVVWQWNKLWKRTKLVLGSFYTLFKT